MSIGNKKVHVGLMVIFALVATVLMTACGGSVEQDDVAVKPQPNESVAVELASEDGETFGFSAEDEASPMPEMGSTTSVMSYLDRRVTWVVRMESVPESLAFCLEYHDRMPDIGADYTMVEGSGIIEDEAARNQITAALNALSDEELTGQYSSRAIAKAVNTYIWRQTDGVDAGSNSIVEMIAERVETGAYEPMDAVWYQANRDSDQSMVMVPPEVEPAPAPGATIGD